METKFTKGEWIIDYDGTKGHIKAVLSGSEHTPTVARYDIFTPYGGVIAEIHREEEIANAKLIASAPHLLDVLNDCAETMNILLIEIKKDDIILRNEVSSRLYQINKAIKKATE